MYVVCSRTNFHVFTFGNSSYTYDFLAITLSGYWYGLGFRPSRESENALLKSYEEGDLRLQAYFKSDKPGETDKWGDYTEIKYNYQYPIKYRRKYSSGAEKPISKIRLGVESS